MEPTKEIYTKLENLKNKYGLKWRGVATDTVEHQSGLPHGYICRVIKAYNINNNDSNFDRLIEITRKIDLTDDKLQQNLTDFKKRAN
jgi:hypothetical protein